MVDAPTLLETDAVPFLVRLLVVAVAPRSVHHLLVSQDPVDKIDRRLNDEILLANKQVYIVGVACCTIKYRINLPFHFALQT